MRLGIIGPSKLREKEKIKRVAELIARLGHEIIITPDKGSASEYFAQVYKANNGKKIYEVIPLDDKEFGYAFMNTSLGEIINCKTWRNQPEKLNEECKALLCIGYAVGVLAEIAYTKWFKPKPVYIIKELISTKLPEEINKSLDIRYVSIDELGKLLKN